MSDLPGPPPGPAADRIELRGLRGRGRHGVLAAETELGQVFVVDVVLWLDLRSAGTGDDLSRTVNYAEVAGQVHELIAGPPLQLIEALAEQIAAAVLTHPPVARVEVTVHKPAAPIPMPFDDVAVHIVRERTPR